MSNHDMFTCPHCGVETDWVITKETGASGVDASGRIDYMTSVNAEEHFCPHCKRELEWGHPENDPFTGFFYIKGQINGTQF